MKPERKSNEKENGLLKNLQKNRVKAGLGEEEKMDTDPIPVPKANAQQKTKSQGR